MLLLTLALPVVLCQNLQAQTSSRLVASSDYSSDGASLNVNDSTAYSYYTSARGGDLNNTLKYDVSTNWLFLGDSAFSNNYKYLQTFDGNNNILTTIAQSWNGTNWVNWSNIVYTYNSMGNVATITYQSWGGTSWSNIGQDVYSYNTANQLYLDQYNVWNSLTTSFLPSNQRIFYYDGSGRLIQEVDQTYNTGSSLYEYSAETSYSYSLITNTTTHSMWDGSAFVADNMYTETSDSSGDLLTRLYQTFNGSVWVNQTLSVYSGFSGTLPGVQINQSWDTTGGGFWANNRKYMYAYNGFGQMTSSIAESWNPGVGWQFASGDPASFYFYETYDPSSTSVKNVANNFGSVNVFPVPAQNMLHVDLNWNEAQSATIGLYDMSGKQISNLNVPFGSKFNGSIPVNNLANGMYVIKISGTQGQIVKQVVVAH